MWSPPLVPGSVQAVRGISVSPVSVVLKPQSRRWSVSERFSDIVGAYNGVRAAVPDRDVRCGGGAPFFYNHWMVKMKKRRTALAAGHTRKGDAEMKKILTEDQYKQYLEKQRPQSPRKRHGRKE